MLQTYERRARGTSLLPLPFDLDAVARGYSRRKRAIGGFGTGYFTLSQEDLTRDELAEFYNLMIGCRLTEAVATHTSWSGLISEMKLTQDGLTYATSLRPSAFHNRVRVYYSNTTGGRTANAWNENADSSDEFGECGLILSIGGATGTGATALRERELAEYAWPRSRGIGGDAVNRGAASTEGPDVLEVWLSGYWDTLNWRWQETTITNQADTAISTLVAASEFVTAGRIETNALSVRADCYQNPRRLGDLIAEVIQQGDASNNMWQGGVYGGIRFDYEAAPTTWRYQIQRGDLLDKTGVPVDFRELDAGFLCFNPEAPTGWPRPGTAGEWDDPQVGYVDEIEYVRGREFDELRMHFRQDVGAAAVIWHRIRRGNI